MPLRKIRRHFSSHNFIRFNFINLIAAALCIGVGYLVVVISDSGQDTLNDIREIEGIIGAAENLDDLKEKVKKNPQLLEKVKPSMMKKIQAYPGLEDKLKERMKDL